MKLTKKMVDALCVKWNYPERIPGMKKIKVDIPDPDPEAEEGSTMEDTKEIPCHIPNTQSKEEFVRKYTDDYVVNKYRLQHRLDKKDRSDKEADTEVEEEVKKTE